jgi:hypothetical protein
LFGRGAPDYGRYHLNGTRNAPTMVHSEYAQLDISSFSEAERYKLMMGKVIPPHLRW